MEVGLEGCLEMLMFCACCLFICTLKHTHQPHYWLPNRIKKTTSTLIHAFDLICNLSIYYHDDLYDTNMFYVFLWILLVSSRGHITRIKSLSAYRWQIIISIMWTVTGIPKLTSRLVKQTTVARRPLVARKINDLDNPDVLASSIIEVTQLYL